MNFVKFVFDPDAWSEVYAAIRKNKLRTILTMIGVAWGMFLFVLLLGVTRGLQNGFDRNLADAATNSLFVWGETTSMPYQGFQKGRTIELKMSDVRQIKARFPQIELLAPRNSKPNSIPGTLIPLLFLTIPSFAHTQTMSVPSTWSTNNST